MHTLLNSIKSTNQSPNLNSSANNTKTIAENIFKDLKAYGMSDKDIVAISSEILNKLTHDLRSRNEKSNTES